MEGQEIETIWTILPSLLLVFIALPSLKNLYLIEDNKIPSITIKITGHQWYWSYEYSTINLREIERFIDNSNILRLIKTSEILHLPVNTLIRSLISSADVIHSWTVPSIGIKVDALPGRLNQIFLLSKRIGLFTGQCSEICGTNHSFMPIIVIFSSVNNFIKKISSILSYSFKKHNYVKIEIKAYIPQISPMLWIVLIVSILISYLFLINLIPKFPTAIPKRKRIKRKKIFIKW